MKTQSFCLLTICGFALGLSACTSIPASYLREDQGPQYWQRARASSTLYLYGPKAQQMLEEDFAHCRTELAELGRLGGIQFVEANDHAPDIRPPATTYHGKAVYHAESEKEFDEVEETRHDRVRAAYLPYYDMTGCMKAKGWEPAEYVPPDRAEKNVEENGF